MILSHREIAVERLKQKTTEYFLLKLRLKVHRFKYILNYETLQMIFYKNFKNLVDASMRTLIFRAATHNALQLNFAHDPFRGRTRPRQSSSVIGEL